MSDFGAILMAVFRPKPELLDRQIDSLKSQTLDTWQCLVGIDGRDPGTARLVTALIGGDSRFRVIEYPENVGHYRNFERLTYEIQDCASWVAYCDQDDHWYPQKLTQLVARLQSDHQASAVVGAARVVDDQGQLLGIARRRSSSCVQLLLRNEVTGSFAVFRADVVRYAIPFPEGTSVAVHDHWLGVCAAAMGGVVFTDDPLQDYVQHGGNALGETQPTTLSAHLENARADGGLYRHLGIVSRERWGWRVRMAQSLLDRLGSGDTELALRLSAIADGRLSSRLLRILAAERRTGHLSLRTAFSLGLAALAWPSRPN